MGLLKGQKLIPVGVSARHAHVTQEHLEILFGPGHKLTPLSPLSQPGQFASRETVTIRSPRGEIAGVRILGPVRSHTQVEISLTDSRKLGIVIPVRESGAKGVGGAKLVGPEGEVELTDSVIAAERHIHMSPENAAEFGVFDGARVSVKTASGRSVLFENVLVRVNPNYQLDFHIDTDEANAAGLRNGDKVMLVNPFDVPGGRFR
jgi:putative phosphotransacetylase